MELNYCRRCGTPLKSINGRSFRCANNHKIYLNPSPTVGLFLFDQDGDVLLGVRGMEPNKGTLDCFGGFVDGDETIEQALAREIKEELGLDPADYSPPTYLTSATYLYEFDGEHNLVLSSMFYANLHDGASPQASDDVASIHKSKLQDIPPDLIGGADIKQGFIALKRLHGLHDS